MKAKEAAHSFDQLKKDLKSGQLKPVYLLYGEERYLKLTYFQKLVQAFGGQKGDMNTNWYEGKGVNVGAVIDQAETLPFLSERRVIVISESGLLKSGDEKLAEYLIAPCESTVFVFCESDVDERNKLFKAIKTVGLAVQIDQQTPETLKFYIAKYMQREGKQIRVSTAEKILDKTGADMATLFSELEKLVCYCLDRDVIEDADVDAICCKTVENQIFDMLEAVANQNVHQALNLYYDLLALKEPPIKILTLLERQYHILLQIADLRRIGEARENIAGKVGISPYFLSQYMQQASKYSVPALKKALRMCVETDEAIKTGKISDTLGVETLILSQMGKQA